MDCDGEDLCRACMCHLVTKDIKYDLLDARWHLAVESIGCFGKLEDDGPRHLCSDCADKTRDFYQFKLMCIESMKKFQDLLETKLAVQEDSLIYQNDTTTADLLTNDYENVEQETELLDCSTNASPIADQYIVESNVSINTNNEQFEAISIPDHDYTQTAATPLKPQSEELKIRTFQFGPSQKHTVRVQTIIGPEQNETDVKIILQALNKFQKFSCNLCSRTSSTKQIFEAHLRTHRGLQPYVCNRDGCTKTFTDERHFNLHLDAHDGLRRFEICPENGCAKRFRQKKGLRRHMQLVHGDGPPPPAVVCDICGKKLANSTVFHFHRYRHKDRSEWPLVCDHPNCGRRFIVKVDLDTHKRRHKRAVSNQKPNLVCDICNRKMASPKLLYLHGYTHMDKSEWPWSCNECGRRFIVKQNLKIHTQAHHAYRNNPPIQMEDDCDKPFQCDICFRRFAQPRFLNIHSRKMHPKVPPTKVKGNPTSDEQTNKSVVVELDSSQLMFEEEQYLDDC